MPRSKHTSGGRSGPKAGSPTAGYVQLLLERFPHVQLVSLKLLLQNEPFQELCEEYEICTAAAARLERSGTDEAMLREYSALLLRLEGELLRYLSQHESTDGSG